MKTFAYLLPICLLNAFAIANATNEFSIKLGTGAVMFSNISQKAEKSVNIKNAATEITTGVSFRNTNVPLLFSADYNIGTHFNGQFGHLNIKKTFQSIKVGTAIVFENVLHEKHNLSVGMNVGIKQDKFHAFVQSEDDLKDLQTILPNIDIANYSINIVHTKRFCELEVINYYAISKNISITNNFKISHSIGAKHVLIPFKSVGIAFGVNIKI